MSRVIVDYTRAGPGIVTSKHALALLEFLEVCGGAPEDALALVFHKSRQLLGKLRGAGMVYPARADRYVLWLPVGTPAPDTNLFFCRVAVGWLAVRLKESGGRYEKGKAVFPNGAAFNVALVPPAPRGPCLAVAMRPEKVHLHKGSILVNWENLRVKSIRECLKPV